MPLVRFEVRNEYGMGDPELYRAAVKREEPKAVLDGLAVAGLVGILRQLGDMAEFAADIFHDLHEEVIATSARGRKVMTRVRNIESALPSLEKAVKGQTSHIHLAYVPGCDWHARLRTERSHLLSSDLPRFMMDSYEECRDPPRLYLLDKFDNGGSGTCLKRYSDPTFFQKAWDMLSKVEKAENAHRENKYNKIKRKGSHIRNGGKQHSSNTSHVRNGALSDVLISSQRNMSVLFTSASIDLQSISDNRSVPDMRSNQDIISRSTSLGSSSVRHEETNGESTNVWEEKTAVVATSSIYCNDVIMDTGPNLDTGSDFMKPGISPGNLPSSLSLVSAIKREESASETENYADALNTLESETEMETETECCTKLEVGEPPYFDSDSKMIEKPRPGGAVVNSTDKLHESSEMSQIAHSEISQVFNTGNGNGDVSTKKHESRQNSGLVPSDFTEADDVFINQGRSNLDAQSIKYRNDEISFIRQQSPEVSHVAPPVTFVATEINSLDLDNESFVETSPRVGLKPRNASNLYELPQFSEISPLVLPAHPNSQKIRPNAENTIMDEPIVGSSNNGETISRSELHTSILDANSDFDAEICENNAPYITDDNKPDIRKAPFVAGPAKLWTNAGLFGLEPSKPYVFEKDSPLQDASAGTSELNGSRHDLNITEKMDKFPSSSTPNGVSSHEKEGNETIATHNLSSSFSSLAQRFLTSSLRKGISPAPLSYTNTPSTDLNVARSNEHRLSDGSSHLSAQSSPPLEHMKIFIHPLNGNLNSNSNDTTDDLNPIFPDIQIVPGSDSQNGSDSDEDTFCQSYVYSSDDQLSPVLHSNSDVWDQEKVSECFENVPSPSSNYVGFEQTDLPGIESVVFSSLNRNQNEYNEYFVPFNQGNSNENQLMPPPPPLPPAQWRVVKPSVSSSVERQIPLPPSPTPLFQPKFSKKDEKSEKNGETKSINNGKEVNLEAEVLQWHSNKLDQQKLNGHDKPRKETFDANDLDEREDLLDQIRKKSFNLRRTRTSKPNPDSSQTATNSSVSAILEKANAIRQAFVGSDDGCDDDGWSDV